MLILLPSVPTDQLYYYRENWVSGHKTYTLMDVSDGHFRPARDLASLAILIQNEKQVRSDYRRTSVVFKNQVPGYLNGIKDSLSKRSPLDSLEYLTLQKHLGTRIELKIV